MELDDRFDLDDDETRQNFWWRQCEATVLVSAEVTPEAIVATLAATAAAADARQERRFDEDDHQAFISWSWKRDGWFSQRVSPWGTRFEAAGLYGPDLHPVEYWEWPEFADLRPFLTRARKALGSIGEYRLTPGPYTPRPARTRPPRL